MNDPASILERIVAHKKTEIDDLPEYETVPPCARDQEALFAQRPALIAEIKACSPSEGALANPETFDPLAIAAAYAAGGADALSILTDTQFFGGAFSILSDVRAACDLPLLCKDFILSERQVRHARVCGADMVLLIVKILTPETLSALKESIEALGMEAVVEIQTEEERDTALLAGARVILINNRNLMDFSVDPDTAGRLAETIPTKVKVVAASGLTAPVAVRALPPRIDAALIGTALMRADDKAGFLRRCRDASEN